MSVRSSIQSTSLGVLSACALLGACAHAPAPAAMSLSATDLPELGEDMPVAPAPKLLKARLDLDTPVSRLCANPRAKAVLDSDLPGLTTRPEFPFFKNMSLNTLQKMSRGQMSRADLAKVRTELALLAPAPLNADK